jgi:hypothetical protein
MKTATRQPRAGARTRDRPASGTTVGSASERLGEGLRGVAYPILTVVAVVVVAVGQLVEDVGDSPPLQMLPPTLLIQRWTVVALVLYTLVMAAALIRTARRSLAAVEDVVEIPPAAFRRYEERVQHPSTTVDLAVFVLSAVITVLLLIGLRTDLLFDDPVTRLPRALPADPISSIVVLVAYTIIGWAFLRLIYIAARLARVLGQLSREPLRINVFDTSDLIPFGNIALAVALAPAGAIIILLIGLGPPSTLVGWSVLVEATLASVLALLLPLRGIHRQMSVAKDAALGRLNVRIGELYERLAGPLPDEAAEATRIGSTTSALIPLRKTVQEMTTWPFRDTVAFGRAVLIASAPLVYTTLSELIRVFVIGPISP